jgi:hypothetical protein
MRKKTFIFLGLMIILSIPGFSSDAGYDSRENSFEGFTPDLRGESSYSEVNNSAAMQGVVVTGTVTDAQTGEALPGVNILIRGTGQGTVTNIDGNYRIEVPGPQAVLVFSFVGYAQQTQGCGQPADNRYSTEPRTLPHLMKCRLWVTEPSAESVLNRGNKQGPDGKHATGCHPEGGPDVAGARRRCARSEYRRVPRGEYNHKDQGNELDPGRQRRLDRS